MFRPSYPYQDRSLPVEQRMQDLLGRMTREEKIAQTTQIFVLPENRNEIKALIRQRGLGSRILATTNLAGSIREKTLEVDDLNDLQRVAVEESRLGIPLLHGRDVIHGYRTIFPIPLAQAASWDPAIVEEAFTIAAREAAAAGVHWSFAPMLDIARDPRWGRIIEGFGEDPYLASQMAAAAVRGFQGQDYGEPGRLLACAKHYIGYGGAEGGRDYNTAEITENTLRNIYLPPFKAAVQAGVGSVMSGFHDLNGESASGSRYLLTELLKEELGFDGFIVSDWGAVSDLVIHRTAEDRRDAARLAFDAGVDMDMCSQCFLDHLENLINQDVVNDDRLDDAVGRILTAKFRLGLFERPYADPTTAQQAQFTPEHQALARQVAARGMILLQNHGPVLPLAKNLSKIAVIGPLADQRYAMLGSWVLDGLISETQNFIEAIREVLPGVEIPAASGSMSDEMLVHALNADAVILVVGESNGRNGENNSTSTISLPPGQDELIEAVSRLGKPVVLVVMSGRPVNLTRASRFVDAILYAWHPGSLGGKAIVDLLFGDVVPSGKLPVSFPRSEGQIPVHYNHKSTGKTFARYVDGPITPLYPFGFGLSYTTFSFSDLQIDKPVVTLGGSLTVSVRVANTGARAGEEIVQCYLQDCVASVTRPVRELKGFARAALNPGESSVVTFKIGPEEMGFYDRGGAWEIEPGEFKVWVGSDSQASLESCFKVIP
jgi:beta-glucosidase